MIFSLLIIHNHDRISSITHVLHTTTWDYFASHLPDRFSCSPKVVKEAIMTDINNLVQEFWGTSNDGAAGTSFFAMLRLLEILQECFDIMEVCFLISIFSAALDYAEKNLQNSTDPGFRAKFKMLLDDYRKNFDQTFSTCKSKDLGDMLRLLPGVVVQKQMGMQGMTVLYRIKPDLLARLVKSTTIGPLRPPPVSLNPRYSLDDYLSGFLQDRDRSHLYYCDSTLQHIFICRQILSFLDGSIALDLQS